MIWSSLARNRSPSPVVSCFFGRIVFSDAAIESQLAGRGNPKAKSQGSAPSERQTLQSKTLYCTQNRFLFNRLAVVHGRRTKAFLKSRDERKRVEMRFAHLKIHHG